jgi:uncharacterized cupredoxin-like copper-binding protein
MARASSAPSVSLEPTPMNTPARRIRILGSASMTVVAATAVVAGFWTPHVRAAGAHVGRGVPGSHAHGDAPASDVVGRPGNASRASRTIAIDMNDAMRFVPASVEVKAGETVRFVVTNSGRLPHELVLGKESELKAHDDAMRRNPAMAHEEPNMVTLAPGRKGELVWQFGSVGRVDFACLQPGHYGAGMKGLVKVVGTSVAPR